MTTDRTTKLLLALIAIALWMNALNPWLRPITASAQVEELSGIASEVRRISRGLCLNGKIC